MKKLVGILLPILLVLGALALLYLLVLRDLVDPPPDAVVNALVEDAQRYVDDDSEANREAFLAHFTARTLEGLVHAWALQDSEGGPRGSWYQMARGLLNQDGTRAVVGVGLVTEAEDEGAAPTATVTITLDRVERRLSLVREASRWRVEVPLRPAPPR